ncbi:MAG: hypothetical protein K0R26_2442 [Bacteroidota bacterium]|jgi:hypothetical protein|nr:hypothetical protein [Bacteroidota bacterium]
MKKGREDKMNEETKEVKLIFKRKNAVVMKKITLKNSGGGIQKNYQPGPLTYQEAKTEWINKKRKIKWNLIPRNEKNNKG